MNKRIQELADEATKFCDIRDLTTGEYVDKPFVEKFAEKFAELIVKECIEISHVGSSTEDKIKKHFEEGFE